MGVTVSVVVTTRDRLPDLRATLASLAATRVPAGTTAELIVADNSGRDDSGVPAEVARASAAAGAGWVSWRVVRVDRPGQSGAVNRAVEASGGEVLLFTDDDVRVPAEWIGPMTSPIVAGEAELVAGAIGLAPHLVRAWMGPRHFGYLASTACHGAKPGTMIGANHAVSRGVWESVGGLDESIGPGTGYNGADSLLSMMAVLGGARMWGAWGPAVEHHPSAERLSRRSLIVAAERQGRDNAWLAHHWLHAPLNRAKAKWLLSAAVVRAYRATCWWRVPDNRELIWLEREAFWKLVLRLDGSPRRYTRRAARVVNAREMEAVGGMR